MRKLDAFFGVPLCFAATWYGKLRRVFGKGGESAREKLLVVKLSEQGANVILGGPMRRLRRVYKPENTWFMAFEESGKILDVMNFVPPENRILISTQSLKDFAHSLLKALWKVRRLEVDTVLDLEFFSRASALIAWLAGATRRVGVHAYFGDGPYRGHLMTHPVKFNPHLHISQMFEVLAEAAVMPEGVLQRMDFAPSSPEPIKDRFNPSKAELLSVSEMLAGCGWSEGERIVLLNANISDRELIPLRKWEDANYADVGRRLLAHFRDIRILLTGGESERTLVGELEKAIGSERCRSIAGKTNLPELLTLYTKSALMITNDSGPGHFATLTDLPVVVLFGPESPDLWAPLGKNVHVVYRNLACSPCFSVMNGRQSGCTRNACMDMTPEHVFSVACEVLG